MGVIAVAARLVSAGASSARSGGSRINVDVAVVRSATARPVKPGEIGEIVSRGDNLMLEYYNEPEQTKGFFKLGDGWGWTGDVGIIDEDGFITLIDRSKDMIISGGENVYPKEIENVALRASGGGRMRGVRRSRRQVRRNPDRLCAR